MIFTGFSSCVCSYCTVCLDCSSTYKKSSDPVNHSRDSNRSSMAMLDSAATSMHHILRCYISKIHIPLCFFAVASSPLKVMLPTPESQPTSLARSLSYTTQRFLTGMLYSNTYNVPNCAGLPRRRRYYDFCQEKVNNSSKTITATSFAYIAYL